MKRPSLLATAVTATMSSAQPTVGTPPARAEGTDLDRCNGDYGLAEGFRQRRAAATGGPMATLWGRGWFLISNRSYGPWQGKLKFDDVHRTDPWTASKGAN